MIQRVLNFVREKLYLAHKAPSGGFNKGYISAMEDVEEYIEETMWDEGIDEEEEW